MPVSAQGFQQAVHSLEQGKLAPIIRGVVAFIVLVAVTLLYLFVQFAGFNSETAMDQAQIARAVSSGEGFTTRYVRPMALWQLQESGIDIPADGLPDTSNPPLPSLINSIPLSLIKGSLEMEPTDLIYAGDRAIAFTSILIFIVAVFVAYFVARRLFDAQLAFYACAIILVTDILWQFSLSGLAQPLLLLFLMGTAWLILAGLDHQEDEASTGGIAPWLLQLGVGVGFGLLTLTNYVTCWFFLGYLFFAFFYFRPRLLPVAAIVAFLLTLTPWILRNYAVSGTPFGLAIYPISDASFLRTLQPDFDNLFYGIKQKIRLGIVAQIGALFSYIGLSLAAGMFFPSLFHRFKSPAASAFRWCVLAMWVAAVIGMAAYGPIDQPIGNLQLHSIFIPLFVFFGLAFLLVLWNRLHFDLSILRTIFIGVIIVVCAIPMILTLFAGKTRAINWPPYIPPYIAILGNWYQEDEALCSDMPWAVAWYAHRKTLLLPDSPKTMVELSDYEVIGQRISGLYLTPITGNSAFLSEIASGTYREWAPFILRTPNLNAFPLKTPVPLPVDGQTVLYADYDRWTRAAERTAQAAAALEQLRHHRRRSDPDPIANPRTVTLPLRSCPLPRNPTSQRLRPPSPASTPS